MPFIVTTKQPTERGFSLSEEPVHEVTHRAVATLADASEVCVQAVPEDGLKPLEAIAVAKQIGALTGDGGRVEYPDGRVLEVQPVTTAWLARHLDSDDVDGVSAIDAYNARQS